MTKIALRGLVNNPQVRTSFNVHFRISEQKHAITCFHAEPTAVEKFS